MLLILDGVASCRPDAVFGPRTCELLTIRAAPKLDGCFSTSFGRIRKLVEEVIPSLVPMTMAQYFYSLTRHLAYTLRKPFVVGDS